VAPSGALQDGLSRMYYLDIRKRVRDDFDAYRIDETTVEGSKY